MKPEEALLHHLRELRGRRGRFAQPEAAAAELRRLESLIPANSPEREVFERAEIRGEPYKVVALAMHVSERQVYRIRKRLVGLIASAEARVHLQSEVAASPLGAVDTLIKYGWNERADRELERIARTGDAHLTIEVLTRRAMLAAQRGDAARARALLVDARSLFAQETFAETAAVERRLGMAEAYVPYAFGNNPVARRLASTALEPYLRGRPATDPRALTRDLIFFGMMLQEDGAAALAAGVLTHAERVLQQIVEPPRAELAELYVQRAFAHACMVGGFDDAERDAGRAVEIADGNGLLYESAWAHLIRGILREQRGDGAGAYDDGLYALLISAPAVGGDPLVRICFNATRVASDGRNMLETLHGVAAHINGNPLLGMHYELVMARTLYTRRRTRAAVRHATQAIEAFERTPAGAPHLGQAYFLRARARRALGERASDDLEAAVSLLGRGSYVRDQMRALELQRS